MRPCVLNTTHNAETLFYKLTGKFISEHCRQHERLYEVNWLLGHYVFVNQLDKLILIYLMTSTCKMVPDDVTVSYLMNGLIALCTLCTWTATHSSHILCSIELWRTNPLLGNDSVNTFPRKRASATIGRLLLDSGSVNKPSQQQRGSVFCVVRAEKL
jgi:hypothetical protein